jgi:hypothetical protein
MNMAIECDGWICKSIDVEQLYGCFNHAMTMKY